MPVPKRRHSTWRKKIQRFKRYFKIAPASVWSKEEKDHKLPHRQWKGN